MQVFIQREDVFQAMLRDLADILVLSRSLSGLDWGREREGACCPNKHLKSDRKGYFGRLTRAIEWVLSEARPVKGGALWRMLLT